MSETVVDADATRGHPPVRPAGRLFIGLAARVAATGAVPPAAAAIERRLAAHLRRRHPGFAGFCVYSADAGGFAALSETEADALLAGPAMPPPAIDRRRGRVERHLVGPLRRLLLPRLDAAPAPLRGPLARFLTSGRQLVSATFGVLATILEARRRSARRKRMPPPATIDFTGHDLLVLPSVPWDQPGLFACAFRLRQARGLRLLVYCHDAAPLDHPELLPPDQRRLLQTGFADMVSAAASIVCASLSARAALRRFIAAAGLPARPIRVIRPGIEPDPRQQDRPGSLPAVEPRRFALAVAAIGPACNHQLLYDLWGRLAEEIPDRLMPLLCVGEAGWLSGDLIGLIRDDDRLRGRLMVLPDQPDAALGWLYRNCAFTLHPSLVGDWPQPLAESLAVGRYCVASDLPANAELSQGLLDLLDPLDFMAWHAEVARLLTDPGHRAACERRIAAFRPRAWSSAGDELAAEIAACLAAAPAP